jgi:hypothetical protein
MAYSFLADVFPTWKGGDAQPLRDMASGIDLYENFDAAPSKPEMPKPMSTSLAGIVGPPEEDKGLLAESFTDYNLPLETQTGGPGPRPFDTDDDYFKILSEDWLKDTRKWQAQARSPFQPKDYAEEDQREAAAHQDDHTKGCMNVAKHLDGCEECRTRLEHIFTKLLSKGKEVKHNANALSSSLSSSLMDVILLVGIGVFVIFVLDAFVKLGRYLTSD